MLSFFSKKKNGHETPPEDVIQGPDSQPGNGADDFIFVEKKPTDVPNPTSSMYPPLLPTYGNSGLPYPGAYQHSADRVTNLPVSYVQGVPFELSPHLCTKSSFELTQLQVDGILALMTRQMSVDEDYSFTLERSVQNESEY